MDGDKPITGCRLVIHPHEPRGGVGINADVLDLKLGDALDASAAEHGDLNGGGEGSIASVGGGLMELHHILGTKALPHFILRFLPVAGSLTLRPTKGFRSSGTIWCDWSQRQ